ncbi:MAG: hypothetical protein WCI29_10930 [Actinomycetes bacterium]
MSIVVPPELAPVLVAGLLGVAEVDGGPTDEQLVVINSIALHLWRLDPTICEAAEPSVIAAAVADPSIRRRFVQLAIVVSFCRHPNVPEQVARLQSFAAALDIHGDELDVLHSWCSKAAEEASADFIRSYDRYIPLLSEAVAPPSGSGEILPELEALSAMPEGTLGWAFLAFYERHGFHIPGPHTPEPAYYVSHDMNHVIAGYEPTGPGEISLGAFKLAMSDTDANWMAFLANMLIHEAGLLRHGSTSQFIPHSGDIYPDSQGQGAMHLPGAADMFGEALERGAATTKDFSHIDHLAIAHRQLSDIRAEYGVIARADGIDGGLGIALV